MRARAIGQQALVRSVVVLVSAVLVPVVALGGNIDPSSTACKYAWGENVGWINFKPSQGPGVTVTDTAVTGTAWGENIGWVNLSPANGGVVNDGAGNLSGYAWGENVGWIKFNPSNGGVTIGSDGKFAGYAWGENIGWIKFGAANSCLETSWRQADLTPDPFTFVVRTGMARNTLVASNAIYVSGINRAAPISIVGGEYSATSINNGAYTSAPGTINAGDGVKVRLTSSPNYATTTTATLTIGGVNGVFTVTTLDQPVYTLTVAKGGTGSGAVTSDKPGISCGTTCSAPYTEGTVVTLTPAPTATSSFTGWSGACEGTGGCQVTMDQARSVTANFMLQTHPLSVTKSGTGTVSSSPAGISCGPTCSYDFVVMTPVTLSALPGQAMIFGGWSGACAGTGTCTVTMDGAKAVTATFGPAPTTYSITAGTTGPSGGGSINPGGLTVVAAGADQAFNISANPGYRINYVAVDGASVGAVTSHIIKNVQKNYTITADFVASTFTITATAGANGAISPSTYSGFQAGANQTYSITPNAGYRVADVLVDGNSFGALTSYPFTNIQGNHTISATFVANPSYTITATAGAGGSISPVGATTLAGGLSQKYTISPSAGYRIDKVLVDGVNKGAVTSYTFSSLGASHTIDASFVLDTYTITASVTGQNCSGTIDPVGPTPVAGGGSKEFLIGPNDGCKINYVAVNGASVGAVSSYTFSNVRQNYTIKADFVPITYKITVKQGANGTVSPGTYSGFKPGDSRTYSITPNAGYQVTSVVVDGVPQAAATSYTFTNIQANHSITASFTPL